MIRPLVPLLMLSLGACGQAAPPPDDSPGGRLEAAAVARGLVADPAVLSITGSWARESDRLCILESGSETRIGALIDYGDGQGCAASGTVRRSGTVLKVAFGTCRFAARFDGTRILFPAELPAACDAVCTGRASLAALAVERLSDSASEAATLRTPAGRILCAVD